VCARGLVPSQQLFPYLNGYMVELPVTLEYSSADRLNYYINKNQNIPHWPENSMTIRNDTAVILLDLNVFL
jgi:hypothetical protein